jgi:hypothetical protein
LAEKMTNTPYSQEEQELAEKCRIALERNWGAKLPMPKNTHKT